MQKMKKLFSLLLALTLCFALFTACGKTGSDSGSQPTKEPSGGPDVSEPADEGTPGVVHREITIGSTDIYSVGHFDVSAKLNNSYNAYAAFLAYDPMIIIDPITGEATSDILSEFYFDTETKSVVLTLKPNVYFSDGDQMLAEDILYTLQRQSVVPFKSDEFQMMHIDQAVISDDGLTISIPFSETYRPWKNYFDGSNAVMNKSWVEAHGGDNMDFEGLWYAAAAPTG